MSTASAKTMNFFEHQDHAKTKTAWLVFLFLTAVTAIILALYLVIRGVILYISAESGSPLFLWFWEPVIFLVVSLGVAGFIGSASLFKTAQLSKGGSVVAELLGGRLVNPHTAEAKERQLMNIVEEMAIASGLPVPQVYVLPDESEINAFAAGFKPQDAVVAVTQGALDQLSRDELQGVVAHEFSHILYGDMRLNIRLMGVLFGILVIGIIGRTVLRGLGRSGGRRRSGRNDGKGLALILIVSLLLMAIGYIGTLIGRMIQSAICRQREFLADASSVQFTRNPAGIAGALRKVGRVGSKINSPKAEETSHLFFGQALSGWMATHPPLEERIRRIEGGDFDQESSLSPKSEAPGRGASAPSLKENLSFYGGSAVGEKTIPLSPSNVTKQAGAPTQKTLRLGAVLLTMIPEELKKSLGPASLYALLLDQDEKLRQEQLRRLGGSITPEERRQTEDLFKETRRMDPRFRLPMVDLAFPSLRTLSREEQDRFLRNIKILVTADDTITLFEFCLYWLLNHRLAPLDKKDEFPIGSLKARKKEIEHLLCAIVSAGQPDDPMTAQKVLTKGTALLPELKGIPYTPPRSFLPLEQALENLSRLSFKEKEKVIAACAHCVVSDGTVTVEEAELLRVVASALECPLPPFLPND